MVHLSAMATLRYRYYGNLTIFDASSEKDQNSPFVSVPAPNW